MDEGQEEESHLQPVDELGEERGQVQLEKELHDEAGTPADQEEENHPDEHLDHLGAEDDR